MSPFKRALFDFLIPGGLIFSAAFGLIRIQGLPQWVAGPIQVFPLIVLAFGLFFGWYLSSSRLVLSLMTLVLADRAVVLLPQGDPDSAENIVFSAAALLVPLNLMAFAVCKDEAIATWRGLLHLVIVLLQPAAVLWLSQPGQAGLAQSLSQPVVPMVKSGWTPVPQLALVAYLGAFLLIGTRFVLERNLLDSGTLWMLIASFVAFQGVTHGWSPTGCFATAGLILFVTLLQAFHRHTYRDDLTGVPGALAYDEAIARLGKRYVLAVVEIDQLKQYSKQHGKSVSGQVLRVLAQIIMDAAGSGKVYRLAGDEFVVLFPRKTATDTFIALGAIRKAVEETVLYLRGRVRVWEGGSGARAKNKDEVLPVTVSIGVAESGSGQASFAMVTRTAYRALYDAKGEGGNRIKRGTVSADIPKGISAGTGHMVSYSDIEQ